MLLLAYLEDHVCEGKGEDETVADRGTVREVAPATDGRGHDESQWRDGTQEGHVVSNVDGEVDQCKYGNREPGRYKGLSIVWIVSQIQGITEQENSTLLQDCRRSVYAKEGN